MKTKSAPISPSIVVPQFHNSIYEMPLRLYIRCTVDKDLSALIISGVPNDDELTDAWYKIQMDYADVIGDTSLKNYLRCFQKLHNYNSLLQESEHLREIIPQVIVHMIIIGKEFHLYPSMNEIRGKFVSRVNKIHSTRFPFSDESHSNDCKRIRSHEKGLSLKRDIEALKLEQLEKTTDADSKPVTREYFFSTLITLTDHSKIKLDDSITVYEFAQRIKRYQEFCQHQTLTKNGRGINK
jgi:hypothetical protein